MLDIRMTLTGTRGGVMPPRKDMQTDGMPVVQFDYAVETPRDAATGQATGRRTHHPVKVVHEVNEWSPLLFRALVSWSSVTGDIAEQVLQERRALGVNAPVRSSSVPAVATGEIRNSTCATRCTRLKRSRVCTTRRDAR